MFKGMSLKLDEFDNLPDIVGSGVNPVGSQGIAYNLNNADFSLVATTSPNSVPAGLNLIYLQKTSQSVQRIRSRSKTKAHRCVHILHQDNSFILTVSQDRGELPRVPNQVLRSGLLLTWLWSSRRGSSCRCWRILQYHSYGVQPATGVEADCETKLCVRYQQGNATADELCGLEWLPRAVYGAILGH